MKRMSLPGGLLLSATCCAVFVGCSEAPSLTPARVVRSAEEFSTHNETQEPLLLPGGATLPVTAAQPEKLANQPEQGSLRAHELFDKLVAPGTSMDEWNTAHEELLKEGESAVRLLSQKLAGGTEQERELAATTLALLGPDAARAAEQLKKALRDPSLFVQANAAACLVQLPDHAAQAVPALVALLSAEDPQLRQLAAVNLNAAGVDVSSQLEDLKLVLASENSSDVLTPVVELLGRIGPPAESVVPQLQKIAFEQTGELATAANSAILLIKGEAAVEEAQ